MELNLVAKFSNIDKVYDVIHGSTFSFELSETLDSGTIIISKVKIGERLNIKPYDFVCIYDKDNENGFCRYFLVDSFIEDEVNIKDRYFKYTINLMSLTKYLEKIQCPNRSISHSLDEETTNRKSIYGYISSFINFYSPKIKAKKGDNEWEYIQLIELEDSDSFRNKFNIECRDFAFSNPTLRQILTTLMLQVNCLPILKMDTSVDSKGQLILSFVDLNVGNNENIDIRANPSVNYIKRSNASDSYVNVLNNLGENILDENNIVSVKNIGFRDRDDAILKQQENLYLETQYPIYNVSKLALKGFVQLPSVYFNIVSPRFINIRGWKDDDCVYLFNASVSPDNSFYRIILKCPVSNSGTEQMQGKLYNIKVIFFSSETVVNEKKYTKLKEYDYQGELKPSSEVDRFGYFDYLDIQLSDIGLTKEQIDGIVIQGNIDITYPQLPIPAIHSIFQDASFMQPSVGSSPYTRQVLFTNTIFRYLYQKDITKLCKEKAKRDLLETDFLAMENASNIDKLSTYYYGTVEYQIGGNKIEGFSKTYSVAQGWWDNTYTYIENIFNVITKENVFGEGDLSELENNYYGGLKIYLSKAYKNYTSGGTPKIVSPIDTWGNIFTSLFFDLEYQPLNKLNSKYIKQNNKKDNNIALMQLDNSNSGIISFDDFYKSESEKVNRFGNDIVSINQRTSNTNDLYEIGSKVLDNYIIYKSTIKCNYSCYEVNYYASKDAILKTYITSIETKYRAYQYIDYNNATERKENALIYVVVDSNVVFNGSDNISFYNNGDKVINPTSWFLSLLDVNYDTSKCEHYFRYSYEGGDYTKLYANNFSILTYANGLIFSFVEYDNQSYGSYILNSSIVERAKDLGGIAQAWHIKPSSFRVLAYFGFFTKELYDTNITYEGGNASVRDIAEKVWEYPLLPDTSDITSDNKIIALTYNKLNTELFRNTNVNYNFDYGELLNQSVQFEFVNFSNDIIFSENFFNYSRMINRDNLDIVLVFSEEFEVSNEEREYQLSRTIFNKDLISKYCKFEESFVGDYFAIYFTNIEQIFGLGTLNYLKFAIKIGEDSYLDLCCVNRNNCKNTDKATFYITLNDTMSLNVATIDSKKQLDFSKYEIANTTIGNRTLLKKGV